jgi:ligand-binding SRPBCC domain-containing protein
MTVEITRFENEYRLHAEVVLPRSLDQVFPFFSSAHNLEQITPDFLRFQIVTPGEIQVSAGSVINYSLRLHHIPLRWTTLISLWEPPHRFVDEQIRGPYRYWIHNHTFEECSEGVIVRDSVRYQVIGGAIVHNLFVRNDVLNIFRFRQRKLLELFS